MLRPFETLAVIHVFGSCYIGQVERLINYIVVDHEEQLSSVLVLLEPLPDAGAFDEARQVCQRLHSVKGPPTLRQVHTALRDFFLMSRQMFSRAELWISAL